CLERAGLARNAFSRFARRASRARPVPTRMGVSQALRHMPLQCASMLRHLALKDFAVVRSAELEFGPGMTVISGETGAGKSLLVDAQGFLSGLRADSGVVRHGAGRAELSAEFSLDDAPAAFAWLRENELDDHEVCQLRRVIR